MNLLVLNWRTNNLFCRIWLPLQILSLAGVSLRRAHSHFKKHCSIVQRVPPIAPPGNNGNKKSFAFTGGSADLFELGSESNGLNFNSGGVVASGWRSHSKNRSLRLDKVQSSKSGGNKRGQLSEFSSPACSGLWHSTTKRVGLFFQIRVRSGSGIGENFRFRLGLGLGTSIGAVYLINPVLSGNENIDRVFSGISIYF